MLSQPVRVMMHLFYLQILKVITGFSIKLFEVQRNSLSSDCEDYGMSRVGVFVFMWSVVSIINLSQSRRDFN